MIMTGNAKASTFDMFSTNLEWAESLMVGNGIDETVIEEKTCIFFQYIQINMSTAFDMDENTRTYLSLQPPLFILVWAYRCTVSDQLISFVTLAICNKKVCAEEGLSRP